MTSLEILLEIGGLDLDQAAKAVGMYAVGIGKADVLKSADYVVDGLCHFDVDMLF